MSDTTTLASRLRGLHIAVAAFAWFAATAWLRPLTAPDEGRYVGVALHMLQSGDWLVPRLDGMPFFHKPPLFYWLCATAMQLFGINEWAARLPSVLGATLAVVSLFVFLRLHTQQPRNALLAALILATMPFAYIGAQFGNLDMLVAGLMSATVCAGAQAVMQRLAGEPWQRAAASAFALAALGVLAKGLIGLVLPVAIIALWSVRPATWRRLVPLAFFVPGWLVFAAIALPWFVAMQLRFPDFFDYFVVTQHFRRFANVGFNNAQPLWFFLPVIGLLVLPWPLWALGNWRSARSLPGRLDVIDRLMLTWFAVVVVFFSIPQSKLVGYVLPALPPAAWFIARWIGRAIDRSARGRTWLSWTAATAALLCVGAAAGLAVREHKTEGGAIREVAGQVRPGDRVLMVQAFYYELPFYWPAVRDVKVAGDWTPQTAAARDNWQKELYDAGAFDPAQRATTLIAMDSVNARTCEAGTTWVLGSPDLALFKGMRPVASRGSLAIWRFGPHDAPCRSVPAAAIGQESAA